MSDSHRTRCAAVGTNSRLFCSICYLLNTGVAQRSATGTEIGIKNNQQAAIGLDVVISVPASQHAVQTTHIKWMF